MKIITTFLVSIMANCYLFAQDTNIVKQDIHDLLHGRFVGLMIIPKDSAVSVVPWYYTKENNFQGFFNAFNLVENIDSSYEIKRHFESNTKLNPNDIPQPFEIENKRNRNYFITIKGCPNNAKRNDYVSPLYLRMKKLCSNKNTTVNLSKNALKKMNATIGFIYDSKTPDYYIHKYPKCKIVVAENNNKDYVETYYFYNTISDDKILTIINSQFGIVKFM